MNSLGIPAAADLSDHPELEHEILFLTLLLEAGDRLESKDQAVYLNPNSLPWCFEIGSPVLSASTTSRLDL